MDHAWLGSQEHIKEVERLSALNESLGAELQAARTQQAELRRDRDATAAELRAAKEQRASLASRHGEAEAAAGRHEQTAGEAMLPTSHTSYLTFQQSDHLTATAK